MVIITKANFAPLCPAPAEVSAWWCRLPIARRRHLFCRSMISEREDVVRRRFRWTVSHAVPRQWFVWIISKNADGSRGQGRWITDLRTTCVRFLFLFLVSFLLCSADAFPNSLCVSFVDTPLLICVTHSVWCDFPDLLPRL